jgi:hypothetical protein
MGMPAIIVADHGSDGGDDGDDGGDDDATDSGSGSSSGNGCNCYTYSSTGVPLTYNGIPIIANVSCSAGNSNTYATTTEIGGNYVSGPLGGPANGPVYYFPKQTKNCGAETLVAVSTAAKAIGDWIKANAGRLAANLPGAAADYAAGEVTAIEFLVTLLGIASVGDLALILAGAGIVIGTIWLMVECYG